MTESSYTGHSISVDFENADLQDVFRLFADITGLNVVVSPGVSGRVTAVLRDVPWDQVLDVVLRVNGLAYQLDGTVLRIATAADLRREAEERAALSAPMRFSPSDTTGSDGPRGYRTLYVAGDYHHQEIGENTGQALIAGALQGSLVNRSPSQRLDATFSLVTQSDAPASLKAELATLHGEVRRIIEALQQGQPEKAADVANQLEVFDRQAIEPKPASNVLKAAAKGLADLAEVTGNVVQITSAIGRVTQSLGLDALL